MPSERDNWRVVVYPYRSRWQSAVGDHRAECDELVRAIKRHVDDVGDVEVLYDTVCSVCGNSWEEPPGCCDKAIAEWQTAHPEWSIDDNYHWHKAVGDE